MDGKDPKDPKDPKDSKDPKDPFAGLSEPEFFELILCFVANVNGRTVNPSKQTPADILKEVGIIKKVLETKKFPPENEEVVKRYANAFASKSVNTHYFAEKYDFEKTEAHRYMQLVQSSLKKLIEPLT